MVGMIKRLVYLINEILVTLVRRKIRKIVESTQLLRTLHI
ncbi:hypothetical protein MANES_09G076395v8 [Manihot esculenta]|uniref:Uncharacterized protein n=1 Tax=Manihot esculenta TaxID=3983 RepID=A0ACB7H599_MANES|nr:hypothetical protein MANES_09G076395v8 [Manihot esculenta]